jgi:hypothetical protein
MRITRDIVTVLPDPLAGEANVTLSGHRIALTTEEAVLLANEVLDPLPQAA